jgi:phosphate transport system substrate-binding protein
VQSSTGAVRSTVSQDANAIGYISFAEVDSSVKTINIDGVAPSGFVPVAEAKLTD